MVIRIHVPGLQRDYHAYVSADVVPGSIQPTPERQWVSSATNPRGGSYERTGKNLTDEQGRTLYDVPVHISTLQGVEVRDARVRVRGLSQTLPALRLLRPTGDVVVEISKKGFMTITCDSLEPIDMPSTAKHGADHE